MPTEGDEDVGREQNIPLYYGSQYTSYVHDYNHGIIINKIIIIIIIPLEAAGVDIIVIVTIMIVTGVGHVIYVHT